MKRSRQVLAFLLCLVMVLALVACGTPTESINPGTASGGVLKLATNASISTIGYPGGIKASIDYFCAAPSVETLCRYDETGMLEPWLCESYTEDPQAKTLTIKLKPNIKFQDDTPFNAEAVKWNWQEFSAAGRNEIAAITSIEVIDDLTVVAHLDKWNNAIADNALYVAGWMVSPTYVKANGKDAAALNPVGTGPFKFSSFEADVKLSYVKNDSYWIAGQPLLDGVDINFIGDDTTLISAMRTGEIDAVYQASADVSAAMIQDGLVPISKPLTRGIAFFGLFFDSTNPDIPTYDIKVRQAICYAIDEEAIVKLAQGDGLLSYTNQWCAPSSWAYNSETVGYPLDVAKAKELLAETKYADECNIKLVLLGNVTMYSTIATVIQTQLADVGITAEIQLVDQALSNEMTGIGGHWNGAFLSAGKCDADIAPIYARTFTDDGVRYVTGMLHPEDVVDLIDKAQSALTFEEKVEYSKQLSRKIIDDYCLIDPFATQSLFVYANAAVQDSHIAYYHACLWTPETANLKR